MSFSVPPPPSPPGDRVHQTPRSRSQTGERPSHLGACLTQAAGRPRTSGPAGLARPLRSSGLGSGDKVTRAPQPVGRGTGSPIPTHPKATPMVGARTALPPKREPVWPICEVPEAWDWPSGGDAGNGAPNRITGVSDISESDELWLHHAPEAGARRQLPTQPGFSPVSLWEPLVQGVLGCVFLHEDKRGRLALLPVLCGCSVTFTQADAAQSQPLPACVCV